jgi:galactonate dehydratase
MPDIKITDISTAVAANPWKPWLYVKVETDQGIVGYGEGTGGRPEDLITTIEMASEELIGENPFNTERLFTPIYSAGMGPSPHNARGTTALSAIDIALWDIKAKYFDVPIYDLLGGNIHDDELRSYANGWYTDVYENDERSPEKFAMAAEEVVSKGYDAMKFDPFGNHWKRMDREQFNLSIDCVRAVREAVGPDVDLLIEGHKRFSVPMAIEIARELEPSQPAWFEEPTPQDLGAIRKVADNSPVPIATGESMITPEAFPDMLHETKMGINQADIVHTGGITNLKKIAAMSDAEHVDMAPHMASGWITLASSMQVDATMPNFMIQENFVEFAFPDWAEEIVEDPIEVDDGKVVFPDRPGHGINLEWDTIVEKYSYFDHKDKVSTIDLYEHRWEERNLDV